MEYLVVDTLEVLEPWPAWAANNPGPSVPYRLSCNMGSYYLGDCLDKYQGYLAAGDSSENDR